MGQFCSQGSITVWRAVPILQGETELPAGGDNSRLLVDHQQRHSKKKTFYVLNAGDLRGALGRLGLKALRPQCGRGCLGGGRFVFIA